LANLLRPSSDDPRFKGLFFGNQGQPVLRFAWNAKAGKAYPIFLTDPKNFPPLQFSRLISNPTKALIDWHPPYAKKMLQYEVEVIDQAMQKDSSFDKERGRRNRIQILRAIDALNQHQRLLEGQAKIQERAEASTDVLRSEIDKPILKKSVALEEVRKDLRKQKYEEVAIPILKAKLTREATKARDREELSTKEREQAVLSSIAPESIEAIRRQRFINAYLQGATGRTGGQLDKSLKKDLLAPEKVVIISRKTPADLKKEEIIKGEFTGYRPSDLKPELRFQPYTSPTKTKKDFEDEQDRLTSARNDISNDRFKNEITGELLSDEEKKELLEMNRNALDRVEHNINQFKKTPNNRIFKVQGLPVGAGVISDPLSLEGKPIRLIYEKILAKKRGDPKLVEDLERRINLIKQQGAVQSGKQIGGERETSAVFSNTVCSKCAGTGIGGSGQKICRTCGGSGSPLQADFAKRNLFVEQEKKKISSTGGGAFICRDCNKKGFADPRCKKCGGRSIIFDINKKRKEIGEEYVKSTPPLENLFRQQGEFVPSKMAI